MSEAVYIALFCTILTGFVMHYLTKDRDAGVRRVILDREAEVRRREFRRHILKCAYTLERTPHDRPDEVWRAYATMAPEILAEAELVAGDFPREFTALVRRAGEWRHADAESEAHSKNKALRDVLRDSIRDVY